MIINTTEKIYLKTTLSKVNFGTAWGECDQ